MFAQLTTSLLILGVAAVMFKSYFSENLGLSEFIYLIKVEKSIALMA